jgi:hypothetical protein
VTEILDGISVEGLRPVFRCWIERVQNLIDGNGIMYPIKHSDCDYFISGQFLYGESNHLVHTGRFWSD